MNKGVVQVRMDLCHDCATKCANPDCENPCASCPIGSWGKYGDCNSAVPTDTPARGGDTAPVGMRGLGDLVAVVAEPIGRAIGMDKSKCGCARRQEWLNQRVPFRRSSW